ncbi:LOW QUALITY PROTEIN: transmembrane protein, partial [Mycobacterium tuberculosis T46]
TRTPGPRASRLSTVWFPAWTRTISTSEWFRRTWNRRPLVRATVDASALIPTTLKSKLRDFGTSAVKPLHSSCRDLNLN